MNQDYLAYKKSKLKAEGAENKTSRKKVIMWIFLLTFIFCFLFVINVISHYGAKMDIEYGRTLQSQDAITNANSPYVKGSNPIANFIDDKKNQIDSRLKLLQLEEIAPSEAKIIDKNREKTVLDIDHYRSLIEEEKIQEELEKASPPKPAPPQIVHSFSKVLIGRYQSFEDAKNVQNQLRETNGAITFVRKMGNIYSLQVGSYTDEAAAQEVADKYSELNYPVWILQD